MELKEGYKQTEVGVIPEDWDVEELGNFSTVSSGGTPNRKVSHYWNGSIPWITTSLVDFNVITTANEFITEDGMNNSAAKLYKTGTLLMAMYGQGKTRGKISVLGIDATTNQACAAISLNQEVVKDYIFHNLSGRYDEIRNLSNTGNQENLNGLLIKKIQIPLPPTLAEQAAIATALSDTDALISRLETLIAKKRAIKQGAMQHLLKPKEGWVVKKLGEIGVFSKGQGIRKDESSSGDIPCVRYGEIYTNHNDYVKEFYSFISRKVAQTSKRLRNGDVLFAGSGETKAEIGKAVAFIGEVEAYAGGDIVILSPANANSLFLGYLLNTPSVVKQKASRGQGDAVVHISASNLSDILIRIPPTIEDQTRIAQILSDMDAEIAGLEQKLAK